MKKYIFFTFIALSTCVFALDKTDQEAIHQIIEHHATSWNEHSGHGFADDYADDADFVNIFGMAFSGKQEIEERHIQIHQSFLKGSLFEVTDVRLREAKPGIVIAHVYWNISNMRDKNMKGIFTHIFLKNKNKWEIAASQNTQMKS